MQIPKLTAPRSSSIHMRREKATSRMRLFKSFPANEHSLSLSLSLGCLVCHRNRRRRRRHLSMINMYVRVEHNDEVVAHADSNDCQPGCRP